MDALLMKLKKDWEEELDGYSYTDVDASYWVPGQTQIDECPSGCELEIYEQTPTKWAILPNHDAYRQTRICREHKYARIYVIIGPTASVYNWPPEVY